MQATRVLCLGMQVAAVAAGTSPSLDEQRRLVSGVDIRAMTLADLPGMEGLARAPAEEEGGGLGQLGPPLCARLPRLWTGG